MKKLILFSLFFIAVCFSANAQNYTEVVYLKNGSIIRGVIIEQVPGVSVKLQTADKSVFVFKMEEIEKITKEVALKQKKGSEESTVSEDGAPTSFSMNFKGGLLLDGPGELDIEGWGKTSPKVSPLIKMDIDGILTPKFSMGLYFTYCSMAVEDSDIKTSLISVGGTIKPRFMLSENLQLRPGLAFGYNAMKNDQMKDASNGLNVGMQIELTTKLQDGVGFVAELGFISQPTGGNDDGDITFPPIIFLTIGLELFK
jgi:hypothetical protein